MSKCIHEYEIVKTQDEIWKTLLVTTGVTAFMDQIEKVQTYCKKCGKIGEDSGGAND